MHLLAPILPLLVYIGHMSEMFINSNILLSKLKIHIQSFRTRAMLSPNYTKIVVNRIPSLERCLIRYISSLIKEITSLKCICVFNNTFQFLENFFIGKNIGNPLKQENYNGFSSDK